MRITTVRTVGIYHSNGIGQLIFTFVVVGDYQINAQFFAELGFFYCSNTAVHSDDQLDTLLVEIVDGNGIQPIAFLQPTGDIADTICTVTTQKVRQQTGGGDTVHIIVTEYGNFFSAGHGKAYPSRSQIHIRH